MTNSRKRILKKAIINLTLEVLINATFQEIKTVDGLKGKIA